MMTPTAPPMDAVSRGLVLVVLGVLIGVVVAVGAGHLVSTLLFGLPRGSN